MASYGSSVFAIREGVSESARGMLKLTIDVVLGIGLSTFKPGSDRPMGEESKPVLQRVRDALEELSQIMKKDPALSAIPVGKDREISIEKTEETTC